MLDLQEKDMKVALEAAWGASDFLAIDDILTETVLLTQESQNFLLDTVEKSVKFRSFFQSYYMSILWSNYSATRILRNITYIADKEVKKDFLPKYFWLVPREKRSGLYKYVVESKYFASMLALHPELIEEMPRHSSAQTAPASVGKITSVRRNDNNKVQKTTKFDKNFLTSASRRGDIGSIFLLVKTSDSKARDVWVQNFVKTPYLLVTNRSMFLSEHIDILRSIYKPHKLKETGEPGTF